MYLNENDMKVYAEAYWWKKGNINHRIKQLNKHIKKIHETIN